MSEQLPPCKYNKVFGCPSKNPSEIDCLFHMLSDIEGLVHKMYSRLDRSLVPMIDARGIIMDLCLFDARVYSLLKWLKIKYPEQVKRYLQERVEQLKKIDAKRREQIEQVMRHVTGEGQADLYV